MKTTPILSILKNERGVTAVIVGVFILFVGIGIAAFAIDFGYRHVAQNELQNAADAGALAGARALYYEDGSKVNDGVGTDPTGTWTLSANEIAHDAAVANNSAGTAVEVAWTSGTNGPEVQRGHWSFATHLFVADPSTAAIAIANYTTEELDVDLDSDGNCIHFINAVKVIARRQSTPVSAFFSKIFGHQSFTLKAEAVAYRGFAGKINPLELDLPFGICEDSVLDENGNYSCTTGRMVPSTVDTAQWTNFSQDITEEGGSPCPSSTTDSVDDNDLVTLLGICQGPINPGPIYVGKGVRVNNGQQQNAYDSLYGDDNPSDLACWYENRDPDEDGNFQPWNVTVLLTDCASSTCSIVKGTVNVNIVWITGGGNDPHYLEAPTNMSATDTYGDWPTVDETTWITNYSDNGYTYIGEARWANFADHFNLKNYEPNNEEADEHGYIPAPYIKKSIYWIPDCTIGELVGVSGGENYGVLAKIPVLVK